MGVASVLLVFFYFFLYWAFRHTRPHPFRVCFFCAILSRQEPKPRGVTQVNREVSTRKHYSNTNAG